MVCVPSGAFNYFVGSGTFNRCLRLWCDQLPNSCPEAAAAFGGKPLHLNDLGLHVRDANRPQTEWVEVPLRCESDIYDAIHLSYVPPHMRHYVDFE